MVGNPQQIVNGNLFVLQIQIKDQQCAGGGGTGENDLRKYLLDDDDQGRDQRETRQNIADRGIHPFSQCHDRDTGEQAVNIEDKVSGNDERPLLILGLQA